MVWVIIGVCYWFGFGLSLGAFTALGRANSRTHDDSWTGDEFLDCVSLLLWPLSWFTWLSFRLGTVLGNLLTSVR